MLRETLKRNKGITLIALVVTIIVLLILAGVSISMLAGQNGILTNAGNAKNNTKEAQIEEKVKLSVGDALTRGTGTLEDENLKSALNSYIGKDKYKIKGDKAKGWTVQVNENGKSYDISSMGKISKSLPSTAEGQPADTPIKNPTGYGENAQATADGDGKYFAKPDGATYLEGTVDTGVVVSIKESQFVWVPVDDVVLDTSDTSKTEKLPKSSTAGTSSGYTYTPMAVQVENDYKGILYEFSGSNGYLKYAGNENYQGGSTNYREPDVRRNYDGTNYDTVEGKITIDKLTKEYKAMIESVKKYKGFYVARYEAGLETGTNKIVFKNASLSANKCTTTSAHNSKTQSWYGLYEKIKTFTTSSDKVVSSMIWGSQYDAMMNWMAKTGNTVRTTDDTKRNTTTITGKTEEGKKPDIINNIYDLYGCHSEWTLEAWNTSVRAFRGGNYNTIGSPAIRNILYPNQNYNEYSSRATLYIE